MQKGKITVLLFVASLWFGCLFEVFVSSKQKALPSQTRRVEKGESVKVCVFFLVSSEIQYKLLFVFLTQLTTGLKKVVKTVLTLRVY